MDKDDDGTRTDWTAATIYATEGIEGTEGMYVDR